MLKMRKDGDIRDTKNTNKNEMVETWKAESAILETVFEQGLAPDTSDCHLCSWVWRTGFSAATLQWAPLRQKGQWATTIPHRCVIHTSSHFTVGHEETAGSVCAVTSEQDGVWNITQFHPRAVSLPWGGLCLSSPGPHLLHVSSGISKGPQRIPRILDTGMSWGSPIIRSASRVCATRISFTAF